MPHNPETNAVSVSVSASKLQEGTNQHRSNRPAGQLFNWYTAEADAQKSTTQLTSNDPTPMAASILLKNGTVLSHDDQDEQVKVLRNTDILIEGNVISKIGKNLESPSSSQVIDCTGQIVSPGFVDTHHHLWQTQLKGRHADETLLEYFASANVQLNNYTDEDVFWGQLSGCMEAIDVGTTCVLDHAHCCRHDSMSNEALSATVTSGLRSVFAYANPLLMFDSWDEKEIVPRNDPTPAEFGSGHFARLVAGAPYGQGRVTIGLGFDEYYHGKDAVTAAFTEAIKAGVKVFTSHVVGTSMSGPRASVLDAIKDFDLLKNTPNFVLSHCTNLSKEEYALLASTQTPVSSTPETEAQMAHGEPPLFYPGLNTSIGVDCHSNNTSSIPHIARTGLFCARLLTNQDVLAQNKFPTRLRGGTQQLFNLMTIQGAKAMGMEKEIGSLRVGKKADVVIFDAKHSIGMSCVAEADPLLAVARYSDIKDVDTVIIDGVIRKQDGKLRAVVREKITEKGAEPLKDAGAVGEKLDWDAVLQKVLQSMKDIEVRNAKRSRKLAVDIVSKTMAVLPANMIAID